MNATQLVDEPWNSLRRGELSAAPSLPEAIKEVNNTPRMANHRLFTVEPRERQIGSEIAPVNQKSTTAFGERSLQ